MLSVLRDSAFVNGSGRQHRDPAEEIRVILLQSHTTDIGHLLSHHVGFLSLLPMGQHYSEPHWLTPILLEGGQWMKCASVPT